jgi:aminoglycoside/choline kinase family phosphotransferase
VTSAPAGAEDALAAELHEIVRAQLGAEIERLEPLRGVVGHRRTFRAWLRGGAPRTLVARVDRGEPPPGVLPEPPLEPLRAFLEAQGLPVPRRLGGDEARAIDLLEDLGSRELVEVVRGAPGSRRELYAEACALVPRLQALRDPDGRLPAFRRRYDAALIETKARRFAAASLPAGFGRAPSPAEAAAVHEAFAAVADALAGAPARLAHRDFQSSNLLVRDAPAGRRIAMVDLQGALLAPPEYDLVCLLRGSYVVLPEEEVHAQAELVRPRLPDAPDSDTFWRRFDLLTIVRKGKDHALWYELAARGRRDALVFAPATFSYVRAAAARCAGMDARLARFAELIEALAPRLAPEERSCGR